MMGEHVTIRVRAAHMDKAEEILENIQSEADMRRYEEELRHYDAFADLDDDDDLGLGRDDPEPLDLSEPDYVWRGIR
jgi:hypothetical protein